MTIPTLPSTSNPVVGRDDKGKKVIINSIGGALVNVRGTVIEGPFTFTYRRNKEDKGIRKKGPIITSDPYWLVQLDDWKYEKYLSFIASELDGVQVCK